VTISLEDLNPEQRKAVLATEGPLLVLAGAGSGKTRVLTYRIAHIVCDLGVSPYEVLALTFTNKAAGEMRGRLNGLLESTRGMWVSTFHSMCVRMLRHDADRIGYTGDFTIYDEADMKSLLKDIYDEQQVNARVVPVQRARSMISKAKNSLQSAEDYALSSGGTGPVTRIVSSVYLELEQRMKAANAMDFDDLLVCAWRLLTTCPDVLEGYQQRFSYLLVDEYQDTNHVQYLLVSLLAQRHHNLMVVGDDDQSIYSWRGADVRNILEFERDYPDAQVVKLERNYRSTGNILAAANALVAHNEHRKSKRLFTEAGPGEEVCVYLAADEREEGRWIAEQIDRLRKEEGREYDDFAVLYRTNAQSRVIEDMFLRSGIPYRIVGGTRFFERAEVRDVMAYLKVVVNPADEVSAKRVINTPRRGIGDKTMARLDSVARQQGCTFMEAVQLAASDDAFTPRVRSALASFSGIFEDARMLSGDLRDVVEAIVEKTGLVDALRTTHTDEANARIENIREFYGVAAEYDDNRRREAEDEDREMEPATLADFMAWLALRTDLDALEEDGSSAVLMTVHSAKGLEFPIVFVAGLEEGIFPHLSANTEPAQVEEERRLAYVAITRAQERLFLTYARSRSLYGSVQHNPASRFLSEIGDEGVRTIGAGSDGFSGVGREKRGSRHGMYGDGSTSYPESGRVFGTGSGTGGHSGGAQVAGETFAPGDMVDHKVFGRGTVTAVDGDVLYVTFANGKSKKLLKGYTPMVKIGGK
jgi:DNA helicase-2/ATP-dependent DNA helicase PcrA